MSESAEMTRIPAGMLKLPYFLTSDNFLSESGTKDSGNFRLILIEFDTEALTWDVISVQVRKVQRYSSIVL